MRDAIVQYVREHPGCTAGEIRKAIAPGFRGIRKREINKILYSLASGGLISRQSTTGAPLWSPALAVA